MRTVNQQDIAEGLRTLGVRAGDVLLVHSSLSRFGHVEGGADAVIDALIEAVGPEGTVAVPTHTWGTVNAQQPVFDVRTSPSIVGRITEFFRARPQARRGLHPTHSCAAIGPKTDALLRDHETQVTPCGSKSPYQRLMDLGGKVVFLGVDLRVNTSFHALEEVACVPWLFDRFEMLYTIDHDGRRLPVISRRHSAEMPRDYEKMEPALLERGVMVKGAIGDATVRVVDAAAMRATVVAMMAEDPFLLLAPSAAARERERYESWRKAKASDNGHG
jgi:aminoglycoside 3-N-acetyltransferase